MADESILFIFSVRCILLCWQIGLHNYTLRDPRICCPRAKGCHLAVPLGGLLERTRAPRDLAAGSEGSARAMLPSTCPVLLAAGTAPLRVPPAADTPPTAGDGLEPVTKEQAAQPLGLRSGFRRVREAGRGQCGRSHGETYRPRRCPCWVRLRVRGWALGGGAGVCAWNTPVLLWGAPGRLCGAPAPHFSISAWAPVLLAPKIKK